MRLLIHKNYLGTPHHAVIKDSMFSWTDSLECDMAFGAESSLPSIEPLFKIFGTETPELVPKRFRAAMEVCGVSKAPWSSVVPKSLFNKNLRALIQSLLDSALRVESSSYFEVYKESNRVFDFLAPAVIDLEACERILSKEDNHVVRSIVRGAQGCKTPVPIYDRASTKTGRLTIKSGPQVLTLKKEYRRIFKPSDKSRKIYEVDFSSLEPRVASNIAQRDPGNDVYTSFMKFSGIEISRDAAKLAVLCALYGASTYNLQKQLKEQGSNMTANSLILKVNEYFNISPLATMLKKEAAENHLIENYFGRPIVVDDPRPSVLVNNYLQSTAVDVSLLGFKKICSDMSGTISPLFIIHDAMFFEADECSLSRVVEYLSSGFTIDGLGNFPLKVTEVTNDE